MTTGLQQFEKPLPRVFETHKAVLEAARADQSFAQELTVEPEDIAFDCANLPRRRVVMRIGDRTFVPSPFVFHQVTNLCGYPNRGLRMLGGNSTLAAEVLQYLWDIVVVTEDITTRKLLVDGRYPATPRCRAITSERYTRVYDIELLEEVDRWLVGAGWTPAQANGGGHASRQDVRNALMRSDRRSMFTYKAPEPTVSKHAGEVYRTISIRNSETGGSALSFSEGAWVMVCSNGMMGWGLAKQASHRHVGKVRERVLEQLKTRIQELSAMTVDDGGLIDALAEMAFVGPNDIGSEQSRDDAIRDRLGNYDLSQETIDKTIAAMEAEWNTGMTGSVWNVAQAVSSLATDSIENRIELDQVAGKILQEGTQEIQRKH